MNTNPLGNLPSSTNTRDCRAGVVGSSVCGAAAGGTTGIAIMNSLNWGVGAAACAGGSAIAGGSTIAGMIAGLGLFYLTRSCIREDSVNSRVRSSYEPISDAESRFRSNLS